MNFFIVYMSNIHNNIPWILFYRTLMSEIFVLQDHLYACSNNTCKQRSNRGKLINQIMKTHENYQLVFQNYYISNRDILRMFQ